MEQCADLSHEWRRVRYQTPLLRDQSSICAAQNENTPRVCRLPTKPSMHSIPVRFQIIQAIRFRAAIALVALLASLTAIASTGVIAREAPKLLLANVLGDHIDVTKYLVSEKYDGARAVWDGKTLRFRSGRTVAAPQWFLEKLPSEALDGELWIARGKFDEVSGIVRKETSQKDRIDRRAREVFAT
jgi:hypothetical protein